MRSLCRFSLVLAGLIASVGLQGLANAGFIPVSRFSEISFDGVGIGTGGEPGPDASKDTTNLTASFSEILQGSSSDKEPGGALDSGTWNVAQTSTILPDVIATDSSQTAATSTDFGSPGIFTRNTFRFDFRVAAVTRVLLEGSIVGSSDPADDSFARVQLLQGAASLFNTSFPSGAFPFLTTLQPDVVYTLAVDVSGDTLFNNSTTSSATATLSNLSASVPEPSSLTLVGLGLIGLIAGGRARPARPSSRPRPDPGRTPAVFPNGIQVTKPKGHQLLR